MQEPLSAEATLPAVQLACFTLSATTAFSAQRPHALPWLSTTLNKVSGDLYLAVSIRCSIFKLLGALGLREVHHAAGSRNESAQALIKKKPS